MSGAPWWRDGLRGFAGHCELPLARGNVTIENEEKDAGADLDD
jgi:hypothetical protein